VTYRYDREKDAIVDVDDDSIYLTYHIGGREVFCNIYMLTWGEMRIGISDADKEGNAIILPRESDGISVFQLAQISVRVDSLRRPWPTLTNFQGFETKGQQDEFLNILGGMFEGVSRSRSVVIAGTEKGRLDITPGLQKRLSAGEFLKDSPIMRQRVEQERNAKLLIEELAKRFTGN